MADAHPSAEHPVRVGVLLYHRVGDLETVGPVAALSAARRFLEEPEALEIATVARSRFSVQTAADLTITPRWAFASAPGFDALVVPGGPGVDAAAKDKALRAFVLDAAASVRVLGSVSSGALLLGEFGLLRDQRVTSHPDVLERLEAFEVAEAVAERLVTNSGGIWCAGAADAGIELGLALAGTFFGAEVRDRAAAFLAHSAPTAR